MGKRPTQGKKAKKRAPRRGTAVGLAVAGLGGLLGTTLLVGILTSKTETVPPPPRVDLRAQLAHAEEWEPAANETPIPLPPTKEELTHFDTVKLITSIEGDREPSAKAPRAKPEAPSRAPKNGLLLWPAGITALSSGFGYRDNPLSGGAMQLHRGVDVRAPCGSEVVAAAGGVVSFAEWTDSSGNTVKVTHANGLTTRYAHLSALNVSPGDRVRAGDRLGLSGDTGRMSTGPHLHFEIWKDGQPVNPMAFRYHYLAPGTLGRSTAVVCAGGGGYGAGPMAMGSMDPGNTGSSAEAIYSSFTR
ncbi:MAG: M23 family metallopeptidase [Myxococcaceae bacterium]|nr:M23 family metallopeptidase [Myxococcaceae bacterium]